MTKAETLSPIRTRFRNWKRHPIAKILKYNEFQTHLPCSVTFGRRNAHCRQRCVTIAMGYIMNIFFSQMAHLNILPTIGFLVKPVSRRLPSSTRKTYSRNCTRRSRCALVRVFGRFCNFIFQVGTDHRMIRWCGNFLNFYLLWTVSLILCV